MNSFYSFQYPMPPISKTTISPFITSIQNSVQQSLTSSITNALINRENGNKVTKEAKGVNKGVNKAVDEITNGENKEDKQRVDKDVYMWVDNKGFVQTKADKEGVNKGANRKNKEDKGANRKDKEDKGANRKDKGTNYEGKEETIKDTDTLSPLHFFTPATIPPTYFNKDNEKHKEHKSKPVKQAQVRTDPKQGHLSRVTIFVSFSGIIGQEDFP